MKLSNCRWKVIAFENVFWHVGTYGWEAYTKDVKGAGEIQMLSDKKYPSEEEALEAFKEIARENGIKCVEVLL